MRGKKQPKRKNRNGYQNANYDFWEVESKPYQHPFAPQISGPHQSM
jgi:hypothetical protein